MSTEVQDFADHLMEKVIADGIASVEQHETGPRREGGIAGFEMCRSLRTMDQYQAALTELERESMLLADRTTNGAATMDDYWRHRARLWQVQFAYDRLKATRLLLGLPLSG